MAEYLKSHGRFALQNDITEEHRRGELSDDSTLKQHDKVNSRDQAFHAISRHRDG